MNILQFCSNKLFPLNCKPTILQRVIPVKLAVYSLLAADLKKISPKTPVRKLSNPTTHVTETSFSHL